MSIPALQGHTAPSVSRGWDHIQLFAVVCFPKGCSMLATPDMSFCMFRISLLTGSPDEGDGVRSGAWDKLWHTGLCLHSSSTDVFPQAEGLRFLSQSNRFF